MLYLPFMHKYKHIKALFFLGIFSMLLMHQVLPHWHHQHKVEHTHKVVAHSDSQDHHHDVPEKESSDKGLLGLFLEMHVHSVVANEILVTQNSSVKQLNVKKVLKTSVFANHYSISKRYDETEKVRVYHPPDNYFNYYLSSLDTRGPPALG